MTWIWYGIGVLLHVAFKAAGWAAKAKTWKMQRYFAEFGALNVQAAVAAIAGFFLWESGLLVGWINGALAGVGVAPTTFQLTGSAAESVFAGYCMDSVARTFFMMLPGGKSAEQPSGN